AHNMAFGANSPATSANGDLYNTRYSNSTQNRSAIKDANLDAMIDRQATLIRDPEARKKILLDIQRYIVNSASQITLYGYFEHRVRWKYVQNFIQTASVEETYARLWLDK